MFKVKLNSNLVHSRKDLKSAVDFMESLAKDFAAQSDAFICVEDGSGKTVASVTNRKIVGVFTKQFWGGRKGDEALFCGVETFDATNAILLMEHSDLVCLADHRETTDSIGTDHVDWDGPYEVDICDSICSFFGVESIQAITTEQLEFARTRFQPEPIKEETITLAVKLKLRLSPGTSVTSFVEDLDYRFTSKTKGVTIAATEIVDCD
jgi:hypothetical protein